MSTIEIFAVITGFISVWFLVKQKIAAWPLGIVNVAIYTLIFYESRLYLDMALQIFYIVIQAYGWYNWVYGKNGKNELNVTTLSPNQKYIYAAIGVVFAIVLGYTMKNHTDDSMPYLDAITTTISLIAQWLLTYKKLENWTLWIIADIIYIPMYIYKNLKLTAILYFAFLILSLIGLNQWKKDIRATSTQPSKRKYI